MKKIAVFIFIVSMCAANLSAAVRTFERITDNSAEDISGQLMLEILNMGTSDFDGQMLNMVKFRFVNSPDGVASSISEIYFYDASTLNAVYSTASSEGVDFENIGATTSPGHLSGYTNNPSLTPVLLATQAKNPEPENAVNINEYHEIGFSLLPDITFQDLLDNMNSGALVIGIHIKSILQQDGTDESDSFKTSVPEPATIAILSLGGILIMRKRKKARPAS